MPPFSDQITPDPATGPGEAVTLDCPTCGATLRTAATQSVEAPCPLCGHLLRYEAPARAKLAPFQPRVHRSQDPDFEKHRPARPKRSRRGSLHKAVHDANEFINTRAGQLLACVVLSVLLVYCVLLFFRWDAKRRRPSAPAESPLPAATEGAPAKPPIPIDLPEPVQPAGDPDPFTLSPGRVIEVEKPAR